MKKIVSMFLVSLMVISALAGCGKKEAAGDDKNQPTEAAPSDNTASEAPQDETQQKFDGEKVTVWVSYDAASLGEHYVTLWGELAEDLGIDMEFENMSSEDYKTKIKVALTGNELPDLFTVWGGSYLDPFFEADAVIPVENYLEQYQMEPAAAYKVPAEDGHLYVIPSKEEAYAVTYVNTKLRNEIGIGSNPTTWAELLELVEATNAYNQANGTNLAAIGLGVADRWVGEVLYTVIVNSLDENAFSKLMSGEIDFTDPVFLEAANRIKTLVDMGAFPAGMIQTKSTEANELFMADQYVLYAHQSSVLQKFAAGMDADSLEVIPFPDCQEPVNTAYMTNLMNGNGNIMPGLCISKKAKNPDAAAALATAFAVAANKINVLDYGNPGYLADDTLIPTKEFAKSLTQFSDLVKNVKHLTPYWYAVLPASQGEAWRDLTTALYAQAVTPEKFVEQAKAIFGMDVN